MTTTDPTVNYQRRFWDAIADLGRLNDSIEAWMDDETRDREQIARDIHAGLGDVEARAGQVPGRPAPTSVTHAYYTADYPARLDWLLSEVERLRGEIETRPTDLSWQGVVEKVADRIENLATGWDANYQRIENLITDLPVGDRP